MSSTPSLIDTVRSPAMGVAAAAAAIGLKITFLDVAESLVHLDRNSVFETSSSESDRDGCRSVIEVLSDLTGFSISQAGLTSQVLMLKISPGA
jgi:predicted ATP-grasp superfamily ATP-dependent carboligase